MSERISLLICDLDNTLYDWVSYFVPSFYEMVEKAASILAVDVERLLDDLRKVHQRYRDSEHPFALLEAEVVAERYPNLSRSEAADILDEAFHAFNRSRKRTLTLYPGVISALEKLTDSGIKIVAHTEAKYLSVIDRVSRLNLDKYLSAVYCRERSPSSRPAGRVYESDLATPSVQITELSHHQAKPSAEVLTEICAREGATADGTAYVGDSLTKDILMANRAGVLSIWARYGMANSRSDYDRLVRVSHWTPEDIQKEREIREGAGTITPDHILEHGFFEVVDVLRSHGEVLGRVARSLDN